MKKIFIYITLSLHIFFIWNIHGIFSVFAVAPFDTNLIIHYDAQDIDADGSIVTGEPTNGSNISAWLDAKNSFTWSQIIALGQPLYQTGAINSILPWITFDGTSDLLEIMDESQINLNETFSTKSFALVIETGTDISSLQTIYEQWTHYAWYAFQISGWHLYGWVWNTLDWWVWDEYKVIDYGSISANTTYYITLVHDNTNVRWYLDGALITTLTWSDVQTIHWICKFDTFFGCSLYGTGGTIGIWATQNDTTNLSTESDIQIYQGNYFTGSIWEIISWDTALSSWDVATVDAYLVDRWEPDNIAPTIDSYTPGDGTLFPTGIFSLEFGYSDNVWGSGINSSSGSIILQKWNNAWWVYGSDISGTYLTSNSITTWTGSFDYSWAPYGKYKATFEISDNAWNNVTQEIIFYIDEPELIVNTWSLDIWTIDSFWEYYSWELEITVKTLWAAHNVFLKHNTDLAYLTEDIPQFTGLGYGYDLWPTYSNTITNFWTSTIIWAQSASINTNWLKNIYTYRVKIWALIDMQQAAGDYEWLIDIGIELDY